MRIARWSLIGVVAAAAMVVAGCSSSAPSRTAPSAPGTGAPVTIRIASNTNTGALPVWVAIDEGIFAKHGLDVKFTEVNNVGTLPPQLNKSFDIVFVTSAGAIAATATGIPVTEVAGAYTDTAAQPDSFLMVKKGSDITKLSQLKGKTIGALTIAGTLNYATLNMLNKAGVAPNEVKLITVDGPQQLAQLQSGRVDAVETLVPFSVQIKAAGGTSLGIPFQSMAPSISVIWWGANPTWAAQHADAVKEFRAALTEAIASIKANPSKAHEVGAKYTHLPTALVAQSTDLDYDASVRPQDIPKWISVMKQFADFKGNVDPSEMTFQP
jgi:NitT/TauT family transport system substrate-binding protein